MVRLIPLSEFKEHNVNPVPGMTVDFDGKPGVIMRRTGGRVMVNFNHPLAGKEVVYDVIINKKIENVLVCIKYKQNEATRLHKT